MPGHVHKAVAKVAMEAAGELYELVMSNDALYAEWRRLNPELSAKQLQNRFISKNWGRCIPIARATMALMLRSGLDDASKDAIMDALVLDATLIRGRRRAAGVVGSVGQQKR